MSEVLVRTDALVKRYKRREVVSQVNVSVSAGEVVGLLGPNGAGKTTTFYMITGLIRPSAGSIFFQEKDVTRLPMYRRARLGVGYLAQEPSVFRNLTVAENVMAILETLPIGVRERKQRLDSLLHELDIHTLADQKAYTLSGGERRRLEITRALVTEPLLLLLDEPFNGVDPLAVIDVQNIIKQLQDMGLGILITDHNVRETLSIVDRAYLMYEGRVLREGPGDFLINDKVSRELYLGDRFSM
ncbi:MAG: LPS export ABC transporter ATP-binding protein [Verrucomicrobia bacterium]|nr:LPS export ABC transporter ATP-binding protein [Verrucomicrobiota bacterium]MDA1087598.1 LPS export ABC transporter ATP-binding protein [Verrucomicrobiota bacterium]